ncbi:ATP-binding cassette domain-containing protein [Galbitalea sp. SE-J8]|uniref:ABC transporter ATP-binding protein n=1 Tax=Galbitalea sp. SE-J8 TaxID=3054952 RepID=UPI00259CC4E2|nr:ATP-binding cassette domain-containing protein [Galbitalea sp. SE-J8]MDM4761608.1 ATP-binding cassette domain-containing protein [Galbitalea sp. SE-J8]
MTEVLLEGRGLRRSYTVAREGLLSRPVRHDALVDVDIEVRSGETLAIIGESGSGKSTLVRILLGLDRADAGETLFRGEPVDAAAERRLRRETGIVLQDPYTSLDPRFTIERTIAEPLRAQRVAGDHRALVAEALGHVGLETWRAGQFPHELSGGQRQRVALARAIVHRPRVLAGDEPLSALDVTVRAQILELLRRLRAELGLSIVLVSHDIGLVQSVADRIVVLRGGRVVEAGDAARVLAEPTHPYTRELLASVPTIPEFSR